MSDIRPATLIEEPDKPGDFRVVYVNDDGSCEVSLFIGPDAKDRAMAFAGTYYPAWSDPQAWAAY